jgi:hypothetical protein
MTTEVQSWRSRIVGHGEEAPDQLLANPANWRVHPHRQQKALAQALDRVGWVQSVIVNTTTGHVVDGHLRVGLAISRDEPTVPVDYVDLTEEEERLVLASLDPISSMAVSDAPTLTGLLSGLDVEAELGALLRDVAGLADGKQPRAFDQGQIDERAEQMQSTFANAGAQDGLVEVTCPDCGAEFGVQV